VCGSRQAKQKDKKPASVELNAPKKYKNRGTVFPSQKETNKRNKKGTLRRAPPPPGEEPSVFFSVFCFVRPRPSVCSTFPNPCTVSSRRGNRNRPRAIGAHDLKRKAVSTPSDQNKTKASHLRATRGAVIAARLEPSVHTVPVEHMPARKQPKILLGIIILQTNQALSSPSSLVSTVTPKVVGATRTRSTHIGAIRPIFSYSANTPDRIISSPELSISSFDAVGGFTCPNSSASFFERV
jgi:hypothetical protein